MNDKNTVKIKCNPYTQSIEYYRWDCEIEDWNPITSYESPFSKSEFKNTALQHKAYEIIHHMNDMYNPGNVGLDIFFEGTKEDMDELTAIVNKYFSKCNINVISGEMYLLSAQNVKKQIEDIFSYMARLFKEYPNSEVTESIRKFSDTVRPMIPICVMGLYSAGKSAFINSLIGVELLPSASDPTTSKTYKISSGSKYEIKFSYNNGKGSQKRLKVKLAFTESTYKVNQSGELDIVYALEIIKRYKTVEERMYHALSIINNYDMQRNKNLPDNKKIWRVSNLIEVTLPIEASVLPFNDFDFVIYDTPGSNSASNTDHTEVLKKAMAGQTNGLPIFVTTPDNMDGKDNAELIETIEKLGGALDKNNLMIIVNKSDEKSSNTLKAKKENFSDLTVSKLDPAGTYFVSSVMGLGFKKIISGNFKVEEYEFMGNTVTVKLPEWIDDDYSSVFKSQMNKFTAKNEPFSLYRYNIIPRLQYDSYCDSEVEEKISAYRNSGLLAVELAIRDFAVKYALYNKCRNASDYLSDASEKLKSNLNEKTKQQETLYAKLRTNMSEQEKYVLAQLEAKCKKDKNQYMTLFANNMFFKLNAISSSLEDGLSDIITDDWKKTKEKVKGRSQQKIAMTKAINDFLTCQVNNTWEIEKKLALDFWENKQDEFKQSLLKIIFEKSWLTEEQKNLLKDAIMKIDGTPKYAFSANICKEDILKGIIFIKPDIEKAKSQCMDAFCEGRTSISTTLTDQSTMAFDNMVKEIKNQFQYLVSTHNPNQIKLRDELKRCNTKIDYMNKQIIEIEKHISEIESLTSYKLSEVNIGGQP